MLVVVDWVVKDGPVTVSAFMVVKVAVLGRPVVVVWGGPPLSPEFPPPRLCLGFSVIPSFGICGGPSCGPRGDPSSGLLGGPPYGPCGGPPPGLCGGPATDLSGGPAPGLCGGFPIMSPPFLGGGRPEICLLSLCHGLVPAQYFGPDTFPVLFSF